MKITLKKKIAGRDAARSQSLFRKLTRVSIQKSRQEPDRSGRKPLKRLLAPEMTDPASSGEVEVLPPDPTLSKSGNRRGMHMRENPPPADHMRRIRAMRNIYNGMMPKLACSNCSFASSCPQFKAGYECAFLPFLDSHKVESEEDLMAYAKNLLAGNIRRAHLATIMETLSGAPPSLELSESMALLFDQLMKLHDKMTEHEETTLTIEGEDSIIGKLFGGIGNLLGDTEKALAEPIEVSPLAIADAGQRDSAQHDRISHEVLNDYTKSALAREERVGNTPEIHQGVLV